MPTYVNRLLLVIYLNLLANTSMSQELYGRLEINSLSFLQNSTTEYQKQQYLSVMLEPELRHSFNDNLEFKAKLFYRYDTFSSSRTHNDIRELTLNYYADEWELNAGIGKVFWGVTESRHLVDVINQIDWIESLDQEARLGQPMVQAKLIKDWGQVELFILPYFRTLDFYTQEARPKISSNVLENQAVYQDSTKQNHIDFAMRWSQTFDNLDIGISVFSGTQRTPLFQPKLNQGQLSLIPIYVQSQQLGIDAQYILQGWLLKIELLARQSHDINFNKNQSFAAVTGVEYTHVGIFNSVMDLGIIAEYLHDDMQVITPFQDDFMTGLRFVVNNSASTEILLANIYDLEDSSQVWRLEGSTRMSENTKIKLLARWMTNLDTANQLYQYKNDNLISASFLYYF